MRVNGDLIALVAMVCFYIIMVINMMVSGMETRPTAMVFMMTNLVIFTRVIGKMIFNMAMALNVGKMEATTKDFII